MTGKIARLLLDKGFGFIASGNKEYFFHRSACSNIFEFAEGDTVYFDEEKSDKGPRAGNVRFTTELD